MVFLISFFALFFTSCSMVFTSSVNGRVIDKELGDNGTVQGVSNARVYLYTEKKAWEADLAAFIDGDETTLPDAAGKARYNYFQSTITNASGNFQFSGIIWHTYFSQFGKTADRCEVFLLVYHPDYGLAKNETPYFVVSDVTTELPVLEIEDIWNEGTVFGKVLNWKDNSPLANTTVAVYVPEQWTYTAQGAVQDSSLVFPKRATYTTTTDAQGNWSLTIRYKKMPGHSDTVNKTKVLITWPGEDWRAEDPGAGSPLGTSINGGIVSGDRDINKNGRTALQGDNNDWYLLSPEISASDNPVDTGTVIIQRWRFRAVVSGRVVNNSTGAGLSGAQITLTVPSGGSNSYTVTSQPRETQAGLEEGFFNFGEIVWEISDISISADQKTGKVPCDWQFVLAGYITFTGAPSSLMPDQNTFIVIRAAP